MTDTKQHTRSVWGASPAGTTYGGGAEPGTQEFFEAVIARRSTHEQPWLWEVVPFDSFADREVLEVGCGAGYDAYEIMRNGGKYTGIDLTPENPERVRRHLSPYGFDPDVRVADAEAMPFDDDSFDDVFSNGVLHHTPRMDLAFAEVHRVLRPGGRFFVVLYHRDSVFHWLKLFLTDQVLRGGFRTRTLAERRSMIEFTTSGDLPLVNVYSRGQVRRLLKDAGFAVACVRVRKLTPEDMPDISFLVPVWQRIPQGLLDVVGRAFGWYVVAEARKPEVSR